MVTSISEIVNKACDLKTKEEKVSWLKQNNSVPLRNILICMYDKTKIKFLIPNTSPPYNPSESHDLHGALLRESRKLKYLIDGMGGENVNKLKREQIFIQLLESVDRNDAKLLCKMIEQKPLKGLTSSVINEAFGPIISESKDKE